ncbi:M16 family metallopeptidase [Candidatus Eisenbacteria bacterium]|uniref:M16 family metallopeptidase n=1 Tax=Eiseniibacteriota bacterium TaxID=2212470 RepID=A0ABV6YP12_UNCEI
MRRRCVYAVAVLAAMVAAAVPAAAQNIDAKEYWLDNGMQVLMVERHDSPTIMTAVVARVGSSNEVTGITGITHLFEHMMFKGTETIGTKDIKRDREVMAQLDSLRALMREEEDIMREQLRRGEIADMLDPDAKTDRYRELDAEFDELILEQRELIVKDELNEIYSKHGSFFLNAMTSDDLTMYVVRVPMNKIELMMWMESDRFSNPVFREFYSEREVVREERRLGVESTPTGLIEEDFSAMFWKSSSYHWSVIGWPSDLANITREQAKAYYDTYYSPNNLTLILVGDLDPDQMIKMVRKYFERIPRGKTDPPEVYTLEEKQYGEKRLIAEAETSPQAEILYHTVAWKHQDSYALEVLAGIMSGKTGRLYKKLVEEESIAKSSVEQGGMRMFGGDGLAVSAYQESRKYAGAFQVSAEGVSGVRAEQLEDAMGEVIEELKTDLVTEEELQKVKNSIRVEQIRFMDIMSGIGILFYLGQSAAFGDWTEANNAPDKIDMVTAEDIRRVANEYFTKDGRNVLIINTEGGAEGESPGGQDPQMAQAITMIKSIEDPARLEQMIGMFSMRMDSVEDPEERAAMEELLKIANEHLKELKAAEGM